MSSSETSDGNAGKSSISVGQEEQRREQCMEEEQHRQDDGIEVPADANPHAQVNHQDDGNKAEAKRKRALQNESDAEAGVWEGRADDPDQPGQRPDGGLGGSGPVQP